jgi:hypothetical protein
MADENSIGSRPWANFHELTYWLRQKTREEATTAKKATADATRVSQFADPLTSEGYRMGYVSGIGSDGCCDPALDSS